MAARELDSVLTYWFDTLKPADWFRKSATLDADITQRFASLHLRLANEPLDAATLSTSEALAVVIVLDQFSRNIYRDKAQAFAFDAKALCLAQQLVAQGRDQQLPAQQRMFLYMPYMHSEELAVHDDAVTLFTALGFANNLKFEHQHRDIIKRFGRYPHRNDILGRTSSKAELDFLQQPGSSF
ncbi:DUF924 family protein [Gilvimarinus polysaccharolyticus]|uniref:DUF924 family protein n=1 Tax=Gilvimarinus polysaccharolyticus TaxID=863921 RepID=UPI000673C50D|nr:DUF924 family protein [Gilvimarinus polysaccharolyticus]